MALALWCAVPQQKAAGGYRCVQFRSCELSAACLHCKGPGLKGRTGFMSRGCS
jgi:hypothetical protein